MMTWHLLVAPVHRVRRPAAHVHANACDFRRTTARPIATATPTTAQTFTPSASATTPGPIPDFLAYRSNSLYLADLDLVLRAHTCKLNE